MIVPMIYVNYLIFKLLFPILRLYLHSLVVGIMFLCINSILNFIMLQFYGF